MRLPGRLIPFIIALMLLCSGALAALSPGLAEISRHFEQGGLYTLKLSAQLNAWPDLAEQTLSVLKAISKDKQLLLQVKREDETRHSLGRLMDGALELFTLYAWEDGTGAAMTLHVPDSLAATRYLGSPELPPWQALLGVELNLPDPVEARSALAGIAQSALPLLLPEEKPVKTAVTIKNAGRGASQLVYALKTEQAVAFWEQASPDLLPAFDRLFKALLMGKAPAASASLRTLKPTGTLTVKRFLNKDGQDLGLQITGALELDGKARQLTLFGGQSADGLYLSFKLPAKRGNDTLEAQLSLAYASGSIKGDWRLKTVNGKDRLDASGAISLKSTAEDAAERLTGSLSAKIRRSGAVTQSFDYMLKPDLFLSGTALEGTLQFQEHKAKTIRKDIIFTMNGAMDDVFQPPAALAEVDLLSADGQQTSFAAAQVRNALVPSFNRFLQDLSPDTRLLVLHDLGRERRTRGESVSPPNEVVSQFTVTDDTDPYSTKEDTP